MATDQAPVLWRAHRRTSLLELQGHFELTTQLPRSYAPARYNCGIPACDAVGILMGLCNNRPSRHNSILKNNMPCPALTPRKLSCVYAAAMTTRAMVEPSHALKPAWKRLSDSCALNAAGICKETDQQGVDMRSAACVCCKQTLHTPSCWCLFCMAINRVAAQHVPCGYSQQHETTSPALDLQAAGNWLKKASCRRATTSKIRKARNSSQVPLMPPLLAPLDLLLLC